MHLARILTGFGILAMVALAAAPACLAQPASGWVRDDGAAVRLVAAGRKGPGVLSAGLEIRLDPGFKTYWRNPGDAGVAPHFDWSSSTNLAGVGVHWPAPTAFTDGNGTALGYTKSVVFPLDLTPADPNAAVDLALALDYAVCGTICIPAKANLALRLEPAGLVDPALVRLVAQSRKAVPERVEVGAPGPLSILSAGLKTGSPPVLEVAVRSEPGAATEVALDADDAPVPATLPPMPAGPDGIATFRFELAGEAAKVEGRAMTVTAVSAGRAVETAVRIDAAAKLP